MKLTGSEVMMDTKKILGSLVLGLTCVAAASATTPPAKHPVAQAHKPVAKAAVHRPVQAAPHVAVAKPVMKAPLKPATSTATALPKPAEMVGGLPWYHVTDGFTLAQKLHKPILVDVYTDWCGWCKVMDRHTFPDPAVKEVLGTKFVLVKANAEDGADGEKLAQRYEINSYPTSMFFNSSGNFQASINGFKPPEDFLIGLHEYLNLGKPIAIKKPAPAFVHESAPSGTSVSMPIVKESAAVVSPMPADTAKETPNAEPTLTNTPAQ